MLTSLPWWVGACRLLDVTANGLEGSVLGLVTSAPKLVALRAAQNLFDEPFLGPEADAGVDAPALQQLLLAGNRVWGSVPTGLSRLVMGLESLSLSRNQLSGELPFFIIGHTRLTSIDIR